MCDGDVCLCLALAPPAASCMMMHWLLAILRKKLFHEGQRERHREMKRKERKQGNISARKHVQTSVSLSCSLFLSLAIDMRNSFAVPQDGSLSLSLSLPQKCFVQDGNETLDHHEAQTQASHWLQTQYMHTHTQTLFLCFSLSNTHTLAL